MEPTGIGQNLFFSIWLNRNLLIVCCLWVLLVVGVVGCMGVVGIICC